MLWDTVACRVQVYFRHCAIRLKKSGTKFPKVELIEVGPSLDLLVRRNRQPGDDLRKAAMKQPVVKPLKKVLYSTALHYTTL